MPLARISVYQETTAATLHAISETVYESMVKVANVPANDKFQILSRHAKGELVYPEQGFLGVTYSDNIVFIQITWNEGRSTEVKKAFYRAIAEGIHSKTGLRKEDIIINLVEVKRENWSFGNGDMPFAPV